MANKKKITTAVVASVTALALALSGTFAWQSINQTALNEASDVINPGGRLHDDFNGSNKNVYVENFTDAETGEDIFARVRLDEYFEIVINQGAGADVENTEVITTDATRGELDTYVTHIFGEENATDDYWTWTTGGKAAYMPTFNKDKDSLEADINGTYDGLDPDDDIHYDDYEEIADEKTADAVYDADADNNPDGEKKYVEETHYATETPEAELISMDEWFDRGCPVGNYWVYDEDGWVYWAAPIKPGTATGLLLDEIALNQVMDDSWYYAINVVAQFVTADDLGKTDATGFYADGETVSAKALELLKTIGVDTSGDAGDEGDEGDDWDELSFGIWYEGRNETIWIENPVDFTASGTGAVFSVWEFETGEVIPEYAHWTLTSTDENAYGSVFNEENGSLTVYVDKPVDDIDVGDIYTFDLNLTYDSYSGTAELSATVIIGEKPAMFIDDTEVIMGESNWFYVDYDAEDAGLSFEGGLLKGSTNLGDKYLSGDLDWGEICIDLSDAANDVQIGDELTFTVVLTDNTSNEEIGRLTHTVTVVKAPPEIWVNGHDVYNVVANDDYSLSASGETDGWTFEVVDGYDLASISGTTLSVGTEYGYIEIRATHTDGTTVNEELYIASDWVKIAKVRWDDESESEVILPDTELTTMAGNGLDSLHPIDESDEIVWDDVLWSVEDANGNKLDEEDGVWMSGSTLDSRNDVAANGDVVVYIVATDPFGMFTEQKIKVTITPRPYFTLTNTSDPEDVLVIYHGDWGNMSFSYSETEKKSYKVEFSDAAAGEISADAEYSGWYEAPTFESSVVTFPINDGSGGSNRIDFSVGGDQGYYASLGVTVMLDLEFTYVLNDEACTPENGEIYFSAGDVLTINASIEGGDSASWALEWSKDGEIVHRGTRTYTIELTESLDGQTFQFTLGGEYFNPVNLSFTLRLRTAD